MALDTLCITWQAVDFEAPVKQLKYLVVHVVTPVAVETFMQF